MSNTITFQSLLDWVNLASGLFSLAGIIFIAIQMKQEKERDVKEMRPYVHVSLQISNVNSEELEIHILNVGRTPALNLEIDFTGIDPWCHVRPHSHHFLKENGGIQRLLPNEYRTYYVGRVSELNNLSENLEPIKVTYEMESQHTKFTDEQPYNLPSKNFLRKRTSTQV